MPTTDARTFDTSPDTLWDATVRALGALGWGVDWVDQGGWTIEATTPVTMRSWGERILVQILSRGPTRTELRVTVTLRFQLVGWGVQRRRIEALLDAVDSALGSTAR